MKLRKYGRSAVMGVLAGTLYGSWAVYANWNHDAGHIARAAATQFLLSFCSTSFLTLMIEFMLARGRSLGNLVAAAIGPHTCMVALFVVAHSLAGTPNVVKTIAPSATVGLVYSILYVLKRRRSPLDEPAGDRGLHARAVRGREIASV